jgi:hypothetical protein
MLLPCPTRPLARSCLGPAAADAPPSRKTARLLRRTFPQGADDHARNDRSPLFIPAAIESAVADCSSFANSAFTTADPHDAANSEAVR